MWRWTGRERPPFAEAVQAGQESVWDYPRPPALVPDAREVIVRAGGVEILRTRRALRLLETASPPTFYLPLSDAMRGAFIPATGSSMCEWKGAARQDGGFYGGWITSGIAGPWKGGQAPPAGSDVGALQLLSSGRARVCSSGRLGLSTGVRWRTAPQLCSFLTVCDTYPRLS